MSDIRINDEAHYRGLFEMAPIPLWEEDFSLIKEHLDKLNIKTGEQAEAYFSEKPDMVNYCASLVKIIDVNKATLTMHYTSNKDELLGNLDKLMTIDSLRTLKDEIIALLAGNVDFETEVLNHVVKGHIIHYTVILSIYPGYEETWKRILVVTKDITEKKNIETRLQQKQQELYDFVQIMTHDINNYLSISEGYTALLLAKYNVEYVQKIQRQFGQMKDLLNRSLKLAEAGKIIEKSSEVDITQLIQEIAELIIPNTIIFTLEPIPKINCDKNRVGQLFQNLFINAVTHGNPKSIRVLYQKKKANHMISIENDGKRIPENQLSNIFLAKHSTLENHRGLGLIIVQKIVDAHGWGINVESNEQRTAFILTIPV